MDPENFKNITDTVQTGDVAVIRFFGKITEESATGFCNEFDYLECCIRPKLIRVLINSEGGSVLYGMAIYSIIRNSNVPTECIIEGMAASMASIVWAAGDKSLMRDYSILMIHNPFLPESKNGEKSDLVSAFTKQITTIYRKRFGLKKEHIEAIMNGDAGKDGTFFDDRLAVQAGIIPEENVIRTSKQICEKVQNEISGLENISDIQAALARISAEAEKLKPENKHFQNMSPTLKQKYPMNEEKNLFEYTAVAASLGLKDGYEVKDVIARITTLIGVEAKLTETAKALSDAQTVIAGKEATILNLQKENGELTTNLKVYQDKETEEKKAKINAMVEAAITDGRIDKQSRTQWIQMAEANFSLAEATLRSIPVPDKISNHTPVGFLGAMMGAIAKANVQESVAWVKQFNLFTDDFQDIEFGFGDINLTGEDDFISLNRYESLSLPLLDELDEKGYIFPIKYAGRENGIYISKDQTCSTGDFRTIARNRTINKSRRAVREALLPYVNAPLLVNPATGFLAPSKITAFKTLIGDILNKMKTAQEISGYAVNINPNQNVLVNDTLIISYVIVPVGVATKIYVEEGLSLTDK